MGSYKSRFTGTQVDTAVDLILNMGLQSIEDGAVYRNSDGTFSSLISLNEGASASDTTPSLTTRGEKFVWNRMIPNTEKGTANGVATLDGTIKVPMAQLKHGVANGIADLDETIKVPMAQLHAAENNGLATLDNTGKVPQAQLPSYVDDVLEYATINNFPATGESGKIYVALDTNKTYRWGGSTYVEISQGLALGETDGTAYQGDRGKIAYDHAVETKLSEAKSLGLYKIGTTGEGHISAASAVVKKDITDLGIPGEVSVAPQTFTTQTKVASITVDNVSTDIYVPYNDQPLVNSKTQAGYLPAPGLANANRVWGTDSTGEPAWREWSNSTSQTIILDKDDWSVSKVQTINVAGVSTTNTIVVSPIPAHLDIYGQCGIACMTQQAGSLTFKCEEIPTEDISVNILIID